MKKATRLLVFGLIGGLLTALPEAIGSSTGKNSSNGSGVTFHKGWKQRKTPYKPQWGPSQCGGGGGGGVVSRSSHGVTVSRDSTGLSKKQKVFMENLQELHAAQTALVCRKSSLTTVQRQEMQKQMQKAYSMISKEISKHRDFPFPNRMLDMETALAEVRSGAVQSNIYTRGKSDAQLLAEIQSRQMEYCKKMFGQTKHSKR